LRTELLGELAAWSIATKRNRERQQLKQTQEQLATASFELDATNQKLFASEQQLAEVAGSRDELKQQVETERASLEQVEAELAELKQNSAPARDLSGYAGDIVNFFRTLLPKDTKLPKNTMTKLREILEATED
jgi:chromosome segregation ATPase